MRHYEKVPKPHRHLYLLFLGAVMVATWLSFSRVLSLGFLNLDDFHYITRVRPFNAAKVLETFTSFFEGYHPLTLVSLGLDHHLAGFNPALYHFHNLGLHMVNTLLVSLLSLRLFRSYRVAGIATSVFALHPVHVEAVAWITSRKDLLYAFFYLAALLTYASPRGVPGKRRLLATSGLYLCSLLSKGMAVSLPLTLLCVDLLRNRPLISRRQVFEKAPFFALAILFGVLSIVSQDASGYVTVGDMTRPLHERLALSTHALLLYVRHLLVPLNLAPYYPYPDSFAHGTIPRMAYVAFGAIPAGLVLLLVLAKRYRGLAFCACFFLATLVLVLRIVPVAGFIIADRYNYVSSLAYGLALGIIVRRGMHAEARRWPRAVLCGAVVLYLAALSLLTCRLTEHWRNGLSLWTYAVQVQPNAKFAWNMLGSSLSNERRYAAAIEAFNHAQALDPQNPRSYLNRGFVHYSTNNLEAAITDYTMALTLEPGTPLALNNRGLALFKAGQTNAALQDFNAAIDSSPRHLSRHLFLDNRAMVHLASGDARSAFRDASAAIALKQNFARAYLHRGLAGNVLGDDDERSFSDLISATRLDPEEPEAWGAAVTLCLQTGRKPLAVRLAVEAIHNAGTNALPEALLLLAEEQYADTNERNAPHEEAVSSTPDSE